MALRCGTVRDEVMVGDVVKKGQMAGRQAVVVRYTQSSGGGGALRG